MDDDTSKQGVQHRISEPGQNICSTEVTLDEVVVTWEGAERSQAPSGHRNLTRA